MLKVIHCIAFLGAVYAVAVPPSKLPLPSSSINGSVTLEHSSINNNASNTTHSLFFDSVDEGYRQMRANPDAGSIKSVFYHPSSARTSNFDEVPLGGVSVTTQISVDGNPNNYYTCNSDNNGTWDVQHKPMCNILPVAQSEFATLDPSLNFEKVKKSGLDANAAWNTILGNTTIQSLGIRTDTIAQTPWISLRPATIGSCPTELYGEIVYEFWFIVKVAGHAPVGHDHWNIWVDLNRNVYIIEQGPSPSRRLRRAAMSGPRKSTLSGMTYDMADTDG